MREFNPQTKKGERTSAKVQWSLLMIIYKVTFVRSLVKWLTRKITGMCELQRIVRKHKFAERTIKLEQCLLLSKSAILRSAAEDDENDEEKIRALVSDIMKEKSIIPEMDPPFEDALTTSITQIRSFKHPCNEVDNLRKETYDCENASHETMLHELWGLLKPGHELCDRVSKKWGELGFQGCDPKTDFRGMGLLGLRCMVYFAGNHTEKARHVLQRSYHPVQGYSYAIVSINITSLAYDLLQNGMLRTHFFNEVQGDLSVSDFLYAFSCIFSQFDKFWFESEPENVMAFSRIRKEFLLQLYVHLSPPNFGTLQMA